jgi:hypothetical protein
MQYSQKNPLPVPAVGAFQEVEATIKTVFDWQYALKDEKLLALYEKGKSLAWNASDIDWSVDVDIARLAAESGADEFMNTLMDPPKKFTLESEHEKDSVEEPEVQPPAELVKMMMEFMSARMAPPEP